ncbi:hypothetical protein AB5N19_09279 [Seiridium cardinale]
MEIIILIVSIPPVVINSRDLDMLIDESMDDFPIFSLGVFAGILGFRLLNTIGYLLHYLGYDFRDIFLPELSWRDKTLYGIYTALAWWVYPLT